MTRRPIRCRACGITFIAILEQEDIEDGCREGTLRCARCLDADPRLGQLTRDDLLRAAKFPTGNMRGAERFRKAEDS